jgi:RHS repeat-associated protein
MLGSIVVRHLGVTVRSFNFGYATAPTTQRDRLTQIQECSATDCLQPTSISYQNGTAGIGSPATATGSGPTSGTVRSVDVNGDGRLDLAYSTASGSNRTWWVQLSNGTGFGAPISTGITVLSTANVLLDDFLGDGGTQLLAPNGGVWFLYRFNGTSFVATSSGTTVDAGLAAGQAASADGDGDGLPDLWTVGTNQVRVRRNTSVGGAISFAGTQLTASVLTADSPAQIRGNNSFPRSSVGRVDLNGDGRDDALVGARYPAGPSGSVAVVVGYSIQAGVIAVQAGIYGTLAGFLPARWNDDACTDAVGAASATAVSVSPCNGNAASIFSLGGAVGLVVDWDGDGRTDALYASGGIWQLQRSLSTAVSTAVSTGLSVGTGSWAVNEMNGDGLSDLVYADPVSSNALRFGQHNGVNTPPDLVTSITDGFGVSSNFTYSSIAAAGSCYIRDSAAPAFPARAFVGPLYTACSMTASNGSGGTYTVNYGYYNANLHLQGRGILGFERVYSVDSRDGFVQMETFGQSFPYIGLPTYRLLRQSDWATKIEEASSTWTSLNLGSGFESRAFPYESTKTDDEFEFGGSLNGQWITRAVTTTSVDAFGNATNLTVSVTDKSSSSPFFGETYVTQTVRSITNDVPNWCIGRPHQTTITSTIADSTSQTRTTSSSVDYLYCRNTQDVVEPGSSTLRVATNYGFDGFGNVNSVQVIGKNPDGTDMATRTTSYNFGTRGQFAESINNALGHTTTRSYNYNLGMISGETDPNGLVTSWLYDGYARKTRHDRPDGTYSVWVHYACDSSNGYCGVSDLRYEVIGTEYGVGGSVIRSEYLFYDGFNRLRYDEQQNLSGGLTYHVQGYDSFGRKLYEHVPVSTGAWHYQHFTHDLTGRLTVSALYRAGGVLDRQSVASYQGRAVVSTDPNGNSRTHYYDVRGKLRRLVDPSPGGTTHYNYDHFGNLLSAVDPIGAGSSSTYNLRGFKTTYYDTDAGSWSFVTNSLGELVSQTDAKSQTITLVHDALGRLTARTEPEGTSNWTWGTSAAARNIGKLQSMSGPGYSESYSFDSVSRLSSTTVVADTTYQIEFAYQAITGLLDNVTYPTSTSGYRLRAQYLYQYGILSQVRDYNAPATVWWQLHAQDARGNPIDEQLGNGVHIISSHDELTGHPNWRTSGVNSLFDDHQRLTYQWDLNENLVERVDQLQSGAGCVVSGLCEKFAYDALDRIDSSTLNGATNLDVTFDAAGNITNKSDVGTYTYHPVKRHAVATTSNGWTFDYDANGNMLTGRGQTITWTSFNKPSAVTNGGIYSQFAYTPDRRYWRQVAQYSNGPETTIYIGGLLEKVTGSTSTEYRHMIGAGSATIVVTRSTGVNNNTYYVTQDHLGSSAVVTNSAAAVVVRQNFSAYGARRGNNWTGSPSAADWTAISQTTRRGYTGHSMADNVALVHMNGRMYDPLIGRFLSPDPFVQTLDESQALNPYSYVWNNPLKYVDPSGYFLKRLFRSIKKLFKKIVRIILDDLIRMAVRVVAYAVCTNAGPICEQAINAAIVYSRSKARSSRSAGGSRPFTLPSSTGPPSWGGGGTVAGVPVIYAGGTDDGRGGSPSDQAARPLTALEYFARTLEAIGYALIAFDLANTATIVLAGPDTAIAGAPLVLIGAGLRRSASAGAARGLKAVNLPAWRKVGIDMGHVVERHTVGGTLAAGRTTFPELMSQKGIERAIREAYRYGQRVGGEGDRILMRGTSGGMTIEMWLNRATGAIETAYPVVR